jgi:hypothetical protein
MSAKRCATPEGEDGPGPCGDRSTEQAVVKQCPMCGREFSLAALLEDPAVQPIGMMHAEGDRDGDLERGAYFFNHVCPGCGTSFTVPLASFAPLLGEPVPEHSRKFSPVCKGHCTRLEELSECEADCSSAPYRRFLVRVLLEKRKPARKPG